VSKTQKKIEANEDSAAQMLLDCDIQLRAAAEAFAEEENGETTDALRTAARAFAEAWDACGSERR
jgi:hypothetical protein